MSTLRATARRSGPAAVRPLRIGFVGLGWIGLNRCRALLDSGLAALAGYVDPDGRAGEAAQQLDGRAVRAATLEELLREEIDGVVIATPSALHAEQSIQALDAGCAVFCQKPLGRDAPETRRVVEAARQADRLLAVDFSYRHLQATRAIQKSLRGGHAGRVYACELAFHNAYGPDKPWYYQAREAGGGCLIDLGIHLVDLALLLLDTRELRVLSARMSSGGVPLRSRQEGIEDYVTAQLVSDQDCSVTLTCSWNLPVGCDARIKAAFYGSRAGIALQNVDGSFFDFQAVRCQRNHRVVLAEPPDDWSGRVIVDWAGRLQAGAHFDPGVEQAVRVAHVLDDIYEAAGR